jgi:hypothetical protein
MKKEIFFGPKDNDFKLLFHNQDKLRGIMLDFMLYYALCLELVEVQKRCFHVHKWATRVLDQEKLEEGNVKEKVVSWGMRNDALLSSLIDSNVNMK